MLLLLGFVLAPVYAVLTHLCFLCAAVTALRSLRTQRSRRVDEDGSCATVTVVVADTATLKLWLMLGGMAALSLCGADYVPLMAEMRMLFMAVLLLTTPAVHTEVYDRAFAPLLARTGAAVTSAQSSVFFVRVVSLLVVRVCVWTSMAVMKHVQHSGVVDGDVVHDILGGLAFAQRALDDAAERIARVSATTRRPQLCNDRSDNNNKDDEVERRRQQEQQQQQQQQQHSHSDPVHLSSTLQHLVGALHDGGGGDVYSDARPYNHQDNNNNSGSGVMHAASEVQTALLRHLDGWLRGGRAQTVSHRGTRSRSGHTRVLSASEEQTPSTLMTPRTASAGEAAMRRRRGVDKMFSS